MGKVTAGAGGTKKAELLRMRYRTARTSLLIAAVFGALNTVFLFFENAQFYSPFALMFPQGLMWDCLFWTGKLYTPADYQAYFGMTQNDFLHPDTVYLYAVICLIAIAAIVVCWALSKKHVWALIVGTALMTLDTVSVLWFYDVSWMRLTEYAVRVLMLVILILGVAAHYRLKFIEWTGEDVTVASDAELLAQRPDSPALHALDYGTKSKIIMIYDIEGYTVCYRRVGRINELAVNKTVYDTVDAGPYEQPHELCAYIDGHEITVGTGSDTQSYIRFDGEVVKTSKRGV